MSTVSPMRVLVVDDCDDAATTMAFLLERYGHDAIVAHSGEAALQQAGIIHPDVMFIDLAMPGIDGLSVARRLRETAEFSETPLVAVSGYVDPEDRAQAIAAGFTEFLAKPYALETLQVTMDKLTSSRNRIDASRVATAQWRQLQAELRERLDNYWRNRHRHLTTSVAIEKSGISNLLRVDKRSDADELRQWLKRQRCRVGPVFKPDEGRFGFFVYSKRYCIHELIAKHGGFTVKAARR